MSTTFGCINQLVKSVYKLGIQNYSDSGYGNQAYKDCQKLKSSLEQQQKNCADGDNHPKAKTLTNVYTESTEDASTVKGEFYKLAVGGHNSVKADENDQSEYHS